MIQAIDGTLILKGNGMDLLSDLGIIVFSMAKKGFDSDAIIAAVAAGITRASSDDADDYIDTIIDKVIGSEEKEEEEPKKVSEDTIKKMFGDLFNE